MKLAMPDYFKELLKEQLAPCVSIYLPTLRAKPMAAENPRRFKDLLQQVEAQLRRGYNVSELSFMQQLRGLAADHAFWSAPRDGLAVFASPGLFHTVWLERPVREFCEVADSFHLRPLIRAHQFNGRFQVLCLSQGDVSLWEGDADGLTAVELRNVPRDIIEATSHRSLSPRLAEQAAPEAGGEPRTDSISSTIDVDRFFRIVDQAVWNNHSRHANLPLILCCDVQYADTFHKISRNPNLVEQSIKLNPRGLNAQRIHEEAWKIIEPQYRQQIERILEEYSRAKAYGSGSDDLPQVAEAATFARVGTLLVDADKHIGGKIDPQTGHVQFGDMAEPHCDDLLDDIAEKVIKTGGQVLVIPPAEMPSQTGIAAIYRF